MSSCEAACDPPPQHKPIDLALELAWERQAHLINPACLGGPQTVVPVSEARPQTITQQVEPPDFVSRTQPAPVCHLEQRIRESPHRRDGPKFSFQSGDGLQCANQRSRVRRITPDGFRFAEYALNQANSRVCRRLRSTR